MPKTTTRQQIPHIVKAWSSDVPEDYAKIVFQQWNALAFFAIDHPFIVNCCNLAEENRVQFMLASDWKARDKPSFQLAEKTMWVLPADESACLTLTAYFSSFDDWLTKALSRRLWVADFGDMDKSIVNQYMECINALDRHKLDWRLAIATVETAKIVWGNCKKSKSAKSRSKFNVCVYFVQAKGSNCIKIGVTTDIENRLKAIKTSCPFEVDLLATIPGDVKRERELHRQFAEYRESGEWFRLEGALLQYVEQLVQEATHD